MKQITTLITTVFAVAALAISCSKEVSTTSSQESGIPAGSSLTITAGVDAKSYYNSGQVKWTSSDKLKVFNADNEGSIFTTEDGGKLEATFSCDNWVGEAPVIALHANSDELKNCVCAGTDTKTITGYLNPTQSIVHQGSFAKEAALAVGTVSKSGGSYQISEMKNVFALIGFKVECSNIKKITLTGNNDEDLAGWVDIDYNDGEPTWKTSEVAGKEASKSITVTVAGSGGQSGDKTLFNPGTTYYISVLPQTFTGGITLEIENADGAKAKRVISSPIELLCNQKRSFENILDEGLDFILTIDCTTVTNSTFKYDRDGTVSNLPQRSSGTSATTPAGTDFWAAAYPSYKFNGAVRYWATAGGSNGLNMAGNTYVRFPHISGYKLTSISDVKVVHSSSRNYKITSAAASTYAGGTAVDGGGEQSLGSSSDPATFTLTDTYDKNKDYYIVCNSEAGFRFKLNYKYQTPQE